MQDARQDDQFDMIRTWLLPDVPVLDGDEDFGSYLRRIGFTDSQLRYAQRMFVNAEGDSLPNISATAALGEIRQKANGKGDFRVLDGYDTLAKHLAEGLDIRLTTPVSRVEWLPEGVRVTTPNGVLEADQVVITIPLGVLQSDTITFTPELPADKQEAIRNTRMGPGLKMIYRFSQPIMPPDIMALFSDSLPPMWWSPSFGHNTDQTVWTAFATGDWARELMALGDEGALAKGLETLRIELDMPDLQPEAMHLMNWTEEPYTRGAYSVALPGYPDTRDALARPVGRLYWAGEHTATHGFSSTIHGAYVSGLRAAKEVLSSGSRSQAVS
ncbi:MAG: FAD-dependent oxidoreductase [Chloroflexi bacterium]|nr:FAD-dependent oxidoreductase [Chloroflexota bacterium]